MARPADAWQWPTSGSGGLEAAIAKLAEKPPDPRQTALAARSRLSTAISELERFLATGGSDLSRGWSEWLKLPAVKAELARPQPDFEALREISEGYYAWQVGLEMPQLVAVRRALRGVVSAEEYAAANSPADEYRRRLHELSECVARLHLEPDQDAAQRAGIILAWIEDLSADGASLAKTMRARHCRQNIVGQASGKLINALLEQRVEERQFLTDVILGTYTSGPAYTSGQVSFGVVPNAERGTLEVRLQGLTQTPANVATQRRVRVYSSATTTLSANKRVHMSDQGLALDRATAWCSTNAQITGVSAGSRLVERLAMRRASRMVPQAEVLAARKAEAQASSGLDERADAALGGINDLFCQQIRAPLIRQDALPTLFRFWSDQAHLRLALSQHNDAQLAVASSAPEFSGKCDLAIAAHESMIDNFCESMLGGQTVKDKAWLGLINLLTGTEPRALWVHDRAAPWSVTFAKQRPIEVEFQDDRLTFTLRFARIKHGDREFTEPVEVTARMIPEMTREGPALSREGDVAILFASELSETDIATWRALLSRKFDAVFPAELHFDGLVPPAGGTIGRLRKLKLVEFGASDGWAKLAYELP